MGGFAKVGGGIVECSCILFQGLFILLVLQQLCLADVVVREHDKPDTVYKISRQECRENVVEIRGKIGRYWGVQYRRGIHDHINYYL